MVILFFIITVNKNNNYVKLCNFAVVEVSRYSTAQLAESKLWEVNFLISSIITLVYMPYSSCNWENFSMNSTVVCKLSAHYWSSNDQLISVTNECWLYEVNTKYIENFP